MSESLSVALVGINGFGANYLDILLDDAAPAGPLRFVGAIDPAADASPRLAELRAAGVPTYADLHAFYADRTADLVIVSSPIHWHRPQTCLALERGSHVLCEKPVAGVVQDALAMAAAAAEHQRVAAVGYQMSFSDSLRRLKADILAGDFGAPLRLKTRVFWPRTRSYYQRNGWAGRRQVDGRWTLDSPLNNATAHYLHQMLFVIGDAPNRSAVPVDIRAELYRANPIETFDAAALRCHTENGAEILFFSAHCVEDTEHPAGIAEFENATIDMPGGERFVVRMKDGTTREYECPYTDTDVKLLRVAEAIQTGQPVSCDVVTATPHLLCVNGAHESVPDPIVFGEDIVKIHDPAGDPLRYAEGLMTAFTRGYDDERLPSELGDVPWARAGRNVDLRGYDEYPIAKRDTTS